MLKRPHYIALSLVAFLALVILNLPNQTATQLKLALGGLFLPLFGLASSVHSLAEQTGNSLAPRRALQNQLDQLRRENSQFRAREAQAAEIYRENERLRQALNLQKHIPGKLQFARVSFRDPSNWWRTVQIDVGRQNGIAPDLAVLSLDGFLVGRINQVGATSSRVALIGDPDCRVSAVVDGGNERDAGVISSAANILDPSFVELTYVSRPSSIKLGQRVLTSGLGGVFPRGILIGHVVDTNNVGFGLYTEARVKLVADLSNLEEVWVQLEPGKP
jgi:rod shape-determining protein MreC